MFKQKCSFYVSAGVAFAMSFGMLVAAPAAAAPNSVDVAATVDRNALNPEDTLTLTISISSSDDVSTSQPTLPPLNDFEVLNEWSAQEARAALVTTPNGPEFSNPAHHPLQLYASTKKAGLSQYSGC